MSMPSGVGTRPIGRLDGVGLTLEAVDDPLEHAAVVAVAGPQEGAVLVAAEPVDAEDARQLGGVRTLADLEPVVQVVARRGSR